MTDDAALFFEELTESLATRDFLGPRNPVLVRSASPAFDLAAALGQYCHLPAEIAELLETARARLSGWPDVFAELSRNIGEERGARTENISHYEILVRGLSKELGLDVTKIPASEETRTFLNTLFEGMDDPSLPLAAGCVYALEDSAVPELQVVSDLINAQAFRMGRAALIDLSSADEGTHARREYSLNYFFRLHIYDFEIGHRTFLAEALGSQVVGMRAADEFRRGYEVTINAMANWWLAMAFASPIA